MNKINKTIKILGKLQHILPCEPVLLFRAHLDYCNVIYDQHYNNSFQQKLESIHYNVALAVTGTLRGSSREKFYQKLGSVSLKQRLWFRKLCYFLR